MLHVIIVVALLLGVAASEDTCQVTTMDDLYCPLADVMCCDGTCINK